MLGIDIDLYYIVGDRTQNVALYLISGVQQDIRDDFRVEITREGGGASVIIKDLSAIRFKIWPSGLPQK